MISVMKFLLKSYSKDMSKHFDISMGEKKFYSQSNGYWILLKAYLKHRLNMRRVSTLWVLLLNFFLLFQIKFYIYHKKMMHLWLLQVIWSFKIWSGFSAHNLETFMTTKPQYFLQDTLNHFEAEINLAHL